MAQTHPKRGIVDMKNIRLKLKSSQDGYMTVEATMIFSVLFFSLIFIMFMGMVLYQEVNMQSLAVRASERGAVIYSSRVSDMTTGVKELEDFTERDPYRNVPFMDSGNKENYKALLNSYVGVNLGRNDVITGQVENPGNYVTIEDNLISKKIKVSIQGGYRMPVDSIAEMFGKEGPFEVNTTAVSAVVDSPDFVRNVDLAMDVVKQTAVFESVEKGYNAIMEALKKLTDILE
ncbi:hypothetical protein F220043C3_56690 [Enterocloster asparagiformis]